MTKHTWQDIYAAGEQLNRYPYDFIVSSYFRYRPRREESRPRVLDLGCGAGNHALFFAENGADVLAVDFSTSALDVVKQRAAEKNLTERVTCKQVDFENFDLDDNGFDIVIDRLAVSHVSAIHADTIYNKLVDMMSPGAVLLSNLFTDGHSHKDYGRYDEKQELWLDFSDGIFEHLKCASFYDEPAVRNLLRGYELISLVRESSADLIAGDNKEIWKIIARIPGND